MVRKHRCIKPSNVGNDREVLASYRPSKVDRVEEHNQAVVDLGCVEVVPCDSCSYPNVELYRISRGHYVNDSKYMSSQWIEDEHVITLCPACYKDYPNS